MIDSVEVRHVVNNPSEARRAVRDVLEHRNLDVIDDALLLTSEVVTNAMMHAGSVQTLVCIAIDGTTVRIAVDDASPTPPHEGHPGIDAMIPGGYGVSIVDSIAARWGTDCHVGDGKTVWFELAV